MTKPCATILIVEDEPDIRKFLRTALSAEGHKVVESVTARRGVIDAATHKPDLAIIDLGLPDFDGSDVIRQVRTWSSMPIIVLSARAQESSKIAAFDAGADDYVTKPFGIRELIARVRVALLRALRAVSENHTLSLGPAAIDIKARTAKRDGKSIHLTPIEFRIIACLAENHGMVVTHRQLLTAVWGPTHASDTHYLRIYLKQIRDKLEIDPVQPRYFITEIGIGYRLLTDDQNTHVS